MACFCRDDYGFDEDPEARQRDRELSRELKADAKSQRCHVRLLLLGAGESGKSTIIRQLQIIHGGDDFHFDQDSYTLDILRNVAVNMGEIAAAMAGGRAPLEPAVTLASPENDAHLQYLRTLSDGMSDNARDRELCVERLMPLRTDSEQRERFVQAIEALWADEGVRAAFERSSEYQLSDNAAYFFDRLRSLQELNFRYSNDDVVRLRNQTSGISESTFEMKGHRFRLVDVGGQRQERPKWIQCFTDVTAVIWVASSSGYDLTLREDNKSNRLRESLSLFEGMWKNRFLRNVSVILFLNKQDMLELKMQRSGAGGRLKQFFPEYNGEDNLDSARKFILKQFEDIRDAYDSRSESFKFKTLYTHFTCAVDKNNIERVFEASRDILIRLSLQRMAIL
eukprot:m.104023 g.104023  ORF g.104023 m.104023 type:complete len:395 (-) comp18867_c0_seq9:38-1222(-)